jgi:hypothetical protein
MNFIFDSKIWKGFMQWFGDIKIYPYPMFVMFASTSYKIKGPDVRQIMDVVRPGSVLLRRYDHYISGLMIKGYFTHAAIYIGDGRIIHMLGDGICEDDIMTFCRCDNIAVMNCTDPALAEGAIKKAKDSLAAGVEYDFGFRSLDKKEFYCTELISYCYNYPLQSEAKYTLPDDFLKLPETNKFHLNWIKR